MPRRYHLCHRLRVIPSLGRKQGDEHLRDRAVGQVAGKYFEDFARGRGVAEGAARLIQDAGFFQRTLDLIEQQIVVHHHRRAVGNRVQVAGVAAGERARLVIGDDHAADRLFLRAQRHQREAAQVAKRQQVAFQRGRAADRAQVVDEQALAVEQVVGLDQAAEIERRGVKAEVEQLDQLIVHREIGGGHIRRENFKRALNGVGDFVLRARAAEAGGRAVERRRLLQCGFGALKQIAVVQRDRRVIGERAEELLALRREVLRLIVDHDQPAERRIPPRAGAQRQRCQRPDARFQQRRPHRVAQVGFQNHVGQVAGFLRIDQVAGQRPVPGRAVHGTPDVDAGVILQQHVGVADFLHGKLRQHLIQHRVPLLRLRRARGWFRRGSRSRAGWFPACVRGFAAR